ncbi:MAG: DNA mismatch repair protein MutS, partial [Candidatus Binatia bacterium]
MSKTKKITPMMQQYRRVRGELPSDVLLLFRLGDFYEMFFEDAQEGSKILNVALTKRGTTPMCGIPYHAANGYIARILKAGRKVAICDQVEEAIPGQLVKREVTQIISPGTHFDERILVAERNNFLASVYPLGKFFGIAIVDLTTGDFQTTEVEGEAALMSELERIRPAEMLLPEAATSLRDLIVERFPIINGYDDWVFEPETSVFTVREHFKVASLDGFGLKNRDAAIGAAGGILHYLSRQLRRDVAHLTRLSFYQSADYLALDMTSLRNLEILEPLSRDAPRSASLFGAMNRTATPMGARRLREWLTQPLSEASAIGGRQEVVQAWLDCGRALDRFRERLGEVRDLERTLGRLSVGTGNARDLGTLRQALEQIPFIRGVLAELTLRDDRSNETSDLALQEDGAGESTDAAAQRPKLLRELEEQLGEFPDLVDLFRRALVDEPPLTVREGGMIADGYDAELDELKSASRDGKNWIARMQQEEIEKTGISSLKVRYNSVFGYFIEVTRANV